MKKLIAFSWYGGKYSHLNWLLPLLPETYHYCEPFGGSAAVLLNRKPSPIETYNELDGEVVNFFKVLREEGEALISAISLTPYSREEFVKAVTEPTENLSSFERARRFYVKARQVRTGLAQAATPGRWSYSKTNSCNGMSKEVSAWLNSIDKLREVVERLLTVQIENLPALEIIEKYDTEGTLFYCDPPYPKEARKSKNVFAFEMTDDDHIKLSELLHNVKGKAAVSGYRCNLLDELYSDWNYIEAPEKNCCSVKKPRREILWTNYDLPKSERKYP